MMKRNEAIKNCWSVSPKDRGKKLEENRIKLENHKELENQMVEMFGSSFNIQVIRDVLFHHNYDVEKSLESLLQMAEEEDDNKCKRNPFETIANNLVTIDTFKMNSTDCEEINETNGRNENVNIINHNYENMNKNNNNQRNVDGTNITEIDTSFPKLCTGDAKTIYTNNGGLNNIKNKKVAFKFNKKDTNNLRDSMMANTHHNKGLNKILENDSLNKIPNCDTNGTIVGTAFSAVACTQVASSLKHEKCMEVNKSDRRSWSQDVRDMRKAPPAAGTRTLVTMQEAKEKVQKYMERTAKVLVLLRGCPGTGKSTMAQAIRFNGVVLSTDSFFERRVRGADRGVVYHFEASRLAEAHDWNATRASDCMSRGLSPVIIDNTNTQVWEMLPYVQMAVKHAYSVEVFEPNVSWRLKPGKLARMNTHSVSVEQIRDMLDRYESNITGEMLVSKVLSKAPPSTSLHAGLYADDLHTNDPVTGNTSSVSNDNRANIDNNNNNNSNSNNNNGNVEKDNDFNGFESDGGVNESDGEEWEHGLHNSMDLDISGGEGNYKSDENKHSQKLNYHALDGQPCEGRMKKEEGSILEDDAMLKIEKSLSNMISSIKFQDNHGGCQEDLAKNDCSKGWYGGGHAGVVDDENGRSEGVVDGMKSAEVNGDDNGGNEMCSGVGGVEDESETSHKWDDSGSSDAAVGVEARDWVIVEQLVKGMKTCFENFRVIEQKPFKIGAAEGLTCEANSTTQAKPEHDMQMAKNSVKELNSFHKEIENTPMKIQSSYKLDVSAQTEEQEDSGDSDGELTLLISCFPHVDRNYLRHLYRSCERSSLATADILTDVWFHCNDETPHDLMDEIDEVDEVGQDTGNEAKNNIDNEIIKIKSPEKSSKLSRGISRNMFVINSVSKKCLLDSINGRVFNPKTKYEDSQRLSDLKKVDGSADHPNNPKEFKVDISPDFAYQILNLFSPGVTERPVLSDDVSLLLDEETGRSLLKSLQQALAPKDEAPIQEYNAAEHSSLLSTRIKFKQLVASFPKINKQVLSNIFQASGYSQELSMQTIQQSSLSKPAKDCMTEQFMDDLELRLIQEAIEASLESSSAQQEQPGGSEREGYKLWQVTRNVNSLYQSLLHKVNTSRQRLAHKREQLRLALSNKQYAIAGFYTEDVNSLYRQLKEEKNLAAEILFHKKFEIGLGIVDFHGFTCEQVQANLPSIIKQQRQYMRKRGRDRGHLSIVTGSGYNSPGGTAKIKPLVINYLRKHNLSFRQLTQGVLRVNLLAE